MSRFLLADGSSQIHRAFHALERGPARGLASSDGTPTGALLGFVQILRKAMRQHQPDLVAVTFDRRGPTFRHERFPAYKAQRQATAEDLLTQIELAREAMDALSIRVVDAEGFEADDVIATLTRRAVAAGHDVVILTSDKDMLQLVGPRVVMHHALRDAVLDEKGAAEYFGAPPARVLDVLAIMGDASDNVPGVRGIGEKGARQLVELYGDLESILGALPAIEADERLGRLRKRLASLLTEHAADARLSRELVTLREDVPIDLALDDLACRPPDLARCRDLFGRLELHRLLEELGTEVAALPPSASLSTTGAAYRVACAAEDVEALASRLRAAGRFALDARADGGDVHSSRLVGLAFSSAPGEAFYVPVFHAHGACVDLAELQRSLGPLLADATVLKVGQDTKRDVEVLARHGLPLAGLSFDTMLASYLLDSSRRSHGLESLAADHLAYRTLTHEEVAGAGSAQLTLDQVDSTRVAEYSGEDADVSLQLASKLEPELRAAGLWRVFSEIEMPLVPVLASMELAGVKVDVAVLEELGSELDKRLSQLEHEIHAAAGRAFNIQSPKQLAEVLFDQLGLASRARTSKTGARSTGVEVLEELAAEHPLPALVLEHRELSKLKGTYVDVLPRLVRPDTGRVHTTYHQAVASTGRLSSSDPNLQNIPTRSELGRRIRRAFVAEPGHVLVGADYSQVELRVMAHLSGDEALCDAFARKEDVHRSTAARVFGVMPELVTDEMRRRAKEVNFGILYGMSAHGLAQRLHCSRREAQEVIDRHRGSFPRVQQVIEDIIAGVRADPRHEARTLFGRVRPLPEIVSRNGARRSFAERAAVNAVVQGTAADLIKLAMIALHARLARQHPSARLILQVHDELVVECPEAIAEDVRSAVAEEMENVMELKAPLEAVAEIARSWYDL